MNSVTPEGKAALISPLYPKDQLSLCSLLLLLPSPRGISLPISVPFMSLDPKFLSLVSIAYIYETAKQQAELIEEGPFHL